MENPYDLLPFPSLGGFVPWQFKSFALEKDEHLGKWCYLLLHQPESLGDFIGVPFKTFWKLPQQRFL